MIPCEHCGHTAPITIVKILGRKVLCQDCYRKGYRLVDYEDNLSGQVRHQVVVIKEKSGNGTREAPDSPAV